MGKTCFKLLFYIVLLIFVVSGGNKNQIGAEGKYVSKPCASQDDCASWGPPCHCNLGLHMCVCNVPPSAKSLLN
ncbi:unnamed protein product [Linum tenue]|uniref:Nodule Cysteine-Rich (NCR) secreted peptide n=1 Tax=Linum tenue TaxID=586396 RepID=A0AAV0RES1_9ROSI|nr:unnamed protein product [Linum tenue]